MAHLPSSERKPPTPAFSKRAQAALVRDAMRQLSPEERRQRFIEAGRAFADANAELLARLAK